MQVGSLTQLTATMKYLDWMSFSLMSLEIPIAVSTCLGLYHISEGRYRPFPWSPLVANRTSYQTVTVMEVNRYLKTKLNTALENLLQRAKSDILFKTFKLCTVCVGQGQFYQI